MSIIMYSKNGCPWCNEVRDFLMGKDVSFEEREVRESEENYQELLEKSGQDKTPTFDIEGEIFPDSDVNELKDILKGKGVI